MPVRRAHLVSKNTKGAARSREQPHPSAHLNVGWPTPLDKAQKKRIAFPQEHNRHSTITRALTRLMINSIIQTQPAKKRIDHMATKTWFTSPGRATCMRSKSHTNFAPSHVHPSPDLPGAGRSNQNLASNTNITRP